MEQIFKNSPEQIKSPRERLLGLEKTGKFVFHGSPASFDVAEPKQAKNINETTGEMEKHGTPAISATVLAEHAIFRSLVNEKLCPKDGETKFGADEQGLLHFSATQNLIDIARSGKGKVYVFDKDKFENFEGGPEWRSSEPVSPIEIIEVTFEDLPKNIEVIESE